jgi:AcrR family transcriptional regulator
MKLQRGAEAMSDTTAGDRLDRREMIIEAAISLLGERGFHAVGIDEIGAAAGISGPGIYRHFPNKNAVLVAVAERVSDLLLAGARDIVGAAADDAAALEELVRFHASFAVDDRPLLAVYLHEERSMPEPERGLIRRTQRRYVQEWVEVLQRLRPELDPVETLTAVQAAIGLLNSVVFFDTGLAGDDLAHFLAGRALAALDADPPVRR